MGTGRTIGGAISLVSDDQKVKESALLVDAEVNKYLDGGAFIGTGPLPLGSDAQRHVDPGVAPARRPPAVEERAAPGVLSWPKVARFFDHIDDVRNNYQVWAVYACNFGADAR